VQTARNDGVPDEGRVGRRDVGTDLHGGDPPLSLRGSDAGYGKSIDFIPAAEKHPGVVYFLAVPSDTLCWLKPPVTEERVYTYGGERRSKTILSETERTPVTASSFALNLNRYFWYRRPGFGGHQGTDRL
jgi:hypothetical protein